MIETVGGFLQHNLIVLLAIVLVPMKIGILRLCGDNEAGRAAFLSIPEDLVYVSLGLILGDFSTSGGAFHRWFSHSSHIPMNLAVTVAIGVAVAIVVHVLAKWTNENLKTWRAASNIRPRANPNSNPLQIELNLEDSDMNVRLIQTRHIALASILYMIQIGITIRWIAWIAKVLANGQS